MLDVKINEERLLQLTQRLIQINSEYSEGIVCNHHEIADFLFEYSKEIGLEVVKVEPEIDYPIIMAKLPGKTGKPVLGFIGHYNTHPIGDLSRWTVDPLGGEIKDGYVWGRGVADMKKNLSAAIEATHAIIESGVQLSGDIVHIWFAGEGHHDSALEYMASEGRKSAPVDWYIDMDWCEGKIAKVAGPWVWLNIKTFGKNGHSALFRGDGQKPINAIAKMAKLITELLNVDSWLTYNTHELFNSTWRYSDKPIVEVNIIKGGEKVNEVADECCATVDFRLLPGQSPQGLLDDLNKLVGKIQKEDAEFFLPEIKIFKTTYSRHWELTDEHPVVKAIQESANMVVGEKPGWLGLLFGSRPPLWEVAEVIHYGLAGGRDYHGFDESTKIEDLIQGTRIYVGMIEKLLA